MSQIKVTVTQEDIDNGARNSHNSCAIALAILREFTPTIGVSVVRTNVIVNCVRYKTSIRARKFVKSFDKGKVVKPSTFIFKSEE